MMIQLLSLLLTFAFQLSSASPKRPKEEKILDTDSFSQHRVLALDDDFCCTSNFVSCSASAFCNYSGENCISCMGFWFRPPESGDDCRGLGQACVNIGETSNCCGDGELTCVLDPLSCSTQAPTCQKTRCCSRNGSDCIENDDVCNHSQYHCSRVCHGLWIVRTSPLSCLTHRMPCDPSLNNCCDGMACEEVHALDGPLFLGCSFTPTPTQYSTPIPTTDTTTPFPVTTPSPSSKGTPLSSSNPTPTPTALSPVSPPTQPPTNRPTPTPTPSPTALTAPDEWAFEETFDGDPTSPSQLLLPRNFDYVATHRTSPGEQFTKAYVPFLADHSEDCAGPDPNTTPLPQHYVQTVQTSSGSNPDQSFYICKNHMMSSMGDVDGYSVTSFWPRQEFQFVSNDGSPRTLEFHVNINEGHDRQWWEVMITPRAQLKLAPGPFWAPISEVYPRDRIVLDFDENSRSIQVGSELLDPEGWSVNVNDWREWGFAYPDDPALQDRRIRRKMKIAFASDHIMWGVETQDGSMDEYRVDVPDGYPFDQGLVVFKTHAYTPTKADNFNTYTFHWDNIRFDGPVVGEYEVFEASNVVYLERNGDRPIGDTATVSINLPEVGGLVNPVLFGQVHSPLREQVLVSINGNAYKGIDPFEYDDSDCFSSGWQSFRFELDVSELVDGENSFEWVVGSRPACASGSWIWDGFSIKFLQIQSG